MQDVLGGHELLAGKVAVVTGAASGIGRATAELFVASGAKVVLADIDADLGERVTAGLGERAAFHRTDVSEPEQVQALVDFTVARFGGLHVFCNNAGVGGKLVSFLNDDFRDFDRVIGIDLLGPMLGSQRAARHMKDNGGGSIINISSIGGVNPGGGVMSYRAAKAALIHVSRSIAVELGAYGIRVNCITPAHIPTGITTYDISPVIEANQPLPRHGQPQDVAYAALYLASDQSAQVTGMVLPVDGGTSAGKPNSRVRTPLRDGV